MLLPENICLRPICDADQPLLHDIYCSSREVELAYVRWTPEERSEFLRSQFELQHRYYRMHFPEAEFCIIQYNNQDVGRLYVEWRQSELRLIDITLLTQWRGRGIGSAVMRSLLALADERGKVVVLYAEVNNPVLSLYQRLGFKQIAANGVYFELRRQRRR